MKIKKNKNLIANTSEFLQSFPQQFTHADVHLSWFLMHVQRFVEQFVLQLQRTIFSRLAGATGLSVGTGTKSLSTIFQPQSSGLNVISSSSSSVFQDMICR